MDNATAEKIVAETLRRCDPQECGIDIKAKTIVEALTQENSSKKKLA